MPANDGRHVPSHHHAPARTISAAATAIIMLALAACTATTEGSTSTSLRLGGSAGSWPAPGRRSQRDGGH